MTDVMPAMKKGKKILTETDIDDIQQAAINLISETGIPLKFVESPEFFKFMECLWKLSTNNVDDLKKVPLSRKSV